MKFKIKVNNHDNILGFPNLYKMKLKDTMMELVETESNDEEYELAETIKINNYEFTNSSSVNLSGVGKTIYDSNDYDCIVLSDNRSTDHAVIEHRTYPTFEEQEADNMRHDNYYD